MATDQPEVHLALGIALQKQGKLGKAIVELRRAIGIDPDYHPAFNSLALTQKMSGELKLALKNYDAGIKALSRRIVKAMRNSRASPVLKHREMIGTLWVEYVGYGAIFLATNARGIDGVAWPTANEAVGGAY